MNMTTLIETSNTELLRKLNDFIIKNEKNIYYGKEMDSMLRSLCNELVAAIESCIGPSDVNLQHEVCLTFLTTTLPRIIDIFLRRDTLRPHVPCVTEVLLATARLLAQPVSSEILKLCELRNHLLSGSNNFKFVNPTELGVGGPYAKPVSHRGFYVDHGRPEVVIINRQSVYFWPRDWADVVGGDNAVGHFVRVYFKRRWVEGQIVAYNSKSCTHRVNVVREEALFSDDKDMSGGTDVTQEDVFYAAGLVDTPPVTHRAPVATTETPDISVDLSSCMHTWVDTQYRDRVRSRSQSFETGLSYSEADIGLFVRVWWPKYSTDYYGKIVGYSATEGQHTVVYEDKDERTVRLGERDCEVIRGVPELVMQSAASRSDGSQAMLVGNWHKGTRAQRKPSGGAVAAASAAFYLQPRNEGVCVRPEPHQAHSFSFLLADVIDMYFAEGGFTSLFQVLRDMSAPPPDLHVIIVHMKLVYSLRQRIRKQFFRAIAWEVKEVIPTTILRFKEAQIKTVSQTDINTVLCGLKDIIAHASSSDCNVRREIDIFNLQIAAMLVRSSQLQKRYLGLSAIQGEIEVAMPQVVSLLLRQTSNARGSVRGGNKSPTNGKKSLIGPAYLAQWVEDNNIFDSIFGESLHQDLAAKSEFLLVFLALQRRLTEDHIAAIWQASQGGHEAVVRVLHQLILRIVPVMEPTLRMFLFNLISIVPYSDYSEQHLHLLKEYTVCVLRAQRSEEASPGGSSTSNGSNHGTSLPTQPQAIMSPGMSTGSSNGVATTVATTANDPSSSSGRRGQVAHTPQRIWMGFAVLWQFIQDQPYSSTGNCGTSVIHVSVPIIDLAVQLLVDLLRDEFRDEREIMIQQCMQNIKNGTSVPVSLKIIRMTLSLYPSTSGGWFNVGRSAAKTTTVGILIDRLCKQDNLLTLIFDEISSYHMLYMEQKSTLSNVLYANDVRIKIKGKLCRIPHLSGMMERLHLLSFLLCNSTLCLSEDQLFLLWKVYIEEASSPQVVELFITWVESFLTVEKKSFYVFLCSLSQEGGEDIKSKSKLDILRPLSNLNDYYSESEYSQSFTDNALHSILDQKLGSLVDASAADFSFICRQPMASLCMKLILYANVNSKSIRVDSEGGWLRVSSTLMGLGLLWRMAVDSEEPDVHEAASYLLIELHHRMSPKLKDIDEIRSIFLKHCFSQMSACIQCLRTGEPLPSAENGSFPEDDGVLDSATLARRVKRYVTLMRLFVQRFNHFPKQYCKIIVISGRSSSRLVDLTASLDDTIRSLRERIGSQYHVQIECVGLSRLTKASIELGGPGDTIDTSSTERLDKDEVTLRALKFRPVESVVVTRIETSDSMLNNESNDDASKYTHESTVGKVKKQDIILAKHLCATFIPPLNPFEWLGVDSSGSKDLGNTCPLSNRSGAIEYTPLLSMPVLPLPPHIDMTLATPSISSTDQFSTGKGEITRISRLAKYLGPYLDSKPEHFDQLLQMLDGYLSLEIEGTPESEHEVSMAVWEVVQSLPVHPVLLHTLRTLTHQPGVNNSAFFKELLDPNCPYRLLYTLQIIDGLLTPVAPSSISALHWDRPTLEWAWQFLLMGGAEYLTSLMHILLATLPSIINTAGTNRVHQSHEGHSTGVTRPDAFVLSIVLSEKILHKLLTVDVEYGKWQLDTPYDPGAVFVGTDISSVIPGGMVLTCFDVKHFIPSVMDATLQTSSIVAHVSSSSQLLATVQSFVEYTIILVFGLLMSAEDSLEILDQYEDFHRWIRSVTLRSPHESIRRSACRRISECCAMLLMKCRDETGLSSTQRECRVALFHYIFNCVVCAAHPDYAGALHSNLDINSRGLVGPENYRNAGELYHLIACLMALRSRPEVLLSLGIGSLVSVCGSEENLNQIVHVEARNTWVDERNLCSLFAEKLFTHKAREMFHSPEVDGTLVGILRMLLILSKDSSECKLLLGQYCPPDSVLTTASSEVSLISHLYVNCLFPQQYSRNPPLNSIDSDISTPAVAICQTSLSRHLSYALILELSTTEKANLYSLVNILFKAEFVDSDDSNSSSTMGVISQKKRSYLWEYDPNVLVKAKDAYLGLYNQGATCYMNSFLQQLFHIKSFSDGLLAIDSNEHLESENEALFFELQVLFGFLRLSQKSYCDTLSFCRLFRDYDGEPVKLGEQKDVNEFAAMLFDKLEGNKDCARLLSKHFGGTLVWQTISTESEYRSEREEPFYMITAEVKDKTALEDSLELYVTGEMLTGDNKVNDDNNGKKVEALRRCAIRSLPDVLIIHLKRFDFDLETMNRRKLNDYFTFPENLNMLPYTEEGIQEMESRRRARSQVHEDSSGWDTNLDLPSDETLTTSPKNDSNRTNMRDREYYMYRLKGVVAHTGAIDSGHYYSFIRDQETGKWMEFNDRSVLPFDAESIPGECYGGPIKTKPTESGNDISSNQPPQMKQYNAYILFYERCNDSDTSIRQSSNCSKAGKCSSEQSASTIQPEDIFSFEIDDESNDNNSVTIENETATSMESEVPVVRQPLFHRTRSESMIEDCLTESTSLETAVNSGAAMSKRVLAAVWRENTEFILDRTKFSADYFLFFWKLLEMSIVSEILDEISLVEDLVCGAQTSNENHTDNAISYLDEAKCSQSFCKRILCKLVLASTHFCVEVLARARAHQCIPLFVERLEDIVMRDTSGACAEAVLSELSKDPTGILDNSSDCQSLSLEHTPSTALRSKEILRLERAVHPMLLSVFLECPHTFSVSIMSRLLTWCAKIARPHHMTKYMELNSGSAEGHEHSADEEVYSSEHPQSSVELHRRNEERMESCSQYTSCVTRFVGKLLILVEHFRPDDLLISKGYEVLTDLLMRFSCFGEDEKNMLLQYGAVYRVICSVIVLYPFHKQYPTRNILRNSVDLVSVLVKAVKRSHVAYDPFQYESPISSVKSLSSKDIQAFTTRSFLENAVLVSSASVSGALIHICSMSESREVIKILGCLNDKILECTLNSPPRTDTSLRVYFSVFEEQLLHIARGTVRVAVGSGDSDVRQLLDNERVEMILNDIVPTIVARTSQICQRGHNGDAEYVYSVCSFLYKLGMTSEVGYNIVMSLRNHWKVFSSDLSGRSSRSDAQNYRKASRNDGWG